LAISVCDCSLQFSLIQIFTFFSVYIRHKVAFSTNNNISISVNGMGSTYDNPFIYKVATFDYINTMRLEIIIYNKHFYMRLCSITTYLIMLSQLYLFFVLIQLILFYFVLMQLARVTQNKRVRAGITQNKIVRAGITQTKE
jgi:hypothetical protein